VRFTGVVRQVDIRAARCIGESKGVIPVREPGSAWPTAASRAAGLHIPANVISRIGLRCLPALDNSDEAGDATCVLDQAALDGQFEAGLSALVVLGDSKGAERRQ
jgi:hypothetical protein